MLCDSASISRHTLCDSGLREVARWQIESLTTAWDSFLIDSGRYPTTERGLTRTPQSRAITNWAVCSRVTRITGKPAERSAF